MERISGGFLRYLAFGYELQLIINIPAWPHQSSNPLLPKKTMPFADYYVVFSTMKQHSWLAGLVILAAACGGGDKKADSNSPWPSPPDPTANGKGLNGEMSDGEFGPDGMPIGGDTGPVKFLVRKDDGLFYPAKPVSEEPYSGKIEETSPTDSSLSVKVYQAGVLISIDEFFSGSEQKKSSTTFDALGEVLKKEEWREDGAKVVVASQSPKAKSIYIGRNLKWEESGLGVYRDKPISTVLKVFGAPSDRKVRLTATTRTETWIYKNIKILDFNDAVTLRTVVFGISRNKVVSVHIEKGS